MSGVHCPHVPRVALAPTLPTIASTSTHEKISAVEHGPATILPVHVRRKTDTSEK